ncbi:hypothetical protein SAY87_014153 [Trapa incisa]|uniref:Uncharacterized protein n=1 Tax=Trapa incisa TaxID=236973 RepID=A0AAN7H2J9_9MYRT|nr:hypothetical protein SAY87_014153 [Trapa incisa]
MSERNEYTWTTMMDVLSRFYKLEDAVSLYEQINEKYISIKTTMAAAYSWHGRTHEAKQLFNGIKAEIYRLHKCGVSEN